MITSEVMTFLPVCGAGLWPGLALSAGEIARAEGASRTEKEPGRS